MKRTYLSSLAAIITFFLSFTITSLTNFDLTREIPTTSNFESASIEVKPPVPNGELEVSYLFSREINDDEFVMSQFRVINNGFENVYYSAHSQGGLVYAEIRRNGKQLLTRGMCGTGIKEQVLMPGESVIFEAFTPADGKTFEIGFYFTEGNRREPIKVRKTVSKSLQIRVRD